jgi:hypothetical protein
MKGTFSNLANTGRNSDSLRFSETIHNFQQVHEERVGRCETSSNEGINGGANKCRTGDFDHSVRQTKTCQEKTDLHRVETEEGIVKEMRLLPRQKASESILRIVAENSKQSVVNSSHSLKHSRPITWTLFGTVIERR